jgi:hypothetical protein
MPVSPDLSIFGKNQSFSDYKRANDEFAQRKALQQAQIMQAQAAVQKSLVPDYDEMGKQAFIQAATQGVDSLSPTQKALLIREDAKQQTWGFNQVTGRMEQKPSMLDRAGINLGAPSGSTPTQAPPPATPSPTTITPTAKAALVELYGDDGNAIKTPTLNVPTLGRNVSPRTQQANETGAVESGRKRVDELKSAASTAGAAKQAASTMAALQPNLGYTGTGGNLVAGADKLLSGFGFPDVVAGKPEAREVFQTQGVDAWVKAVEPLKGALTEREGGRFDLAVSNLTTTPAGIKRRAMLTEALAKRASEKSQFYEAYLAQNATLDGADAVWEQYSNENPVITDELLGVETDKQKATNQFNARKNANPLDKYMK